MGQPQGSLGESRRSFGAWSPCYGVGRSSELSPKGVMARHPHAPRPLTLASLLAMKWQAGHTGSIFEPARTSGHSRVLRGCREGVAAHPSLAACPLQLSGRWHTVALASNDSALIRPSGRFRVFISRLDVEDGNLHGQILVPWVQGGGRGGGWAGRAPGRGRRHPAP